MAPDCSRAHSLPGKVLEAAYQPVVRHRSAVQGFEEQAGSVQLEIGRPLYFVGVIETAPVEGQQPGILSLPFLEQLPAFP